LKASAFFYPYLHLYKHEEQTSVLVKASFFSMCQVTFILLSHSAIRLMQCHFLSLLNFTEDFTIITTDHYCSCCRNIEAVLAERCNEQHFSFLRREILVTNNSIQVAETQTHVIFVGRWQDLQQPVSLILQLIIILHFM
jgi:hypothetical protein